MRIISKYKDYYDLQGEMIDNTIIYKRNEANHFVTSSTFPSLFSSNLKASQTGRFFFLGFCGKIYLGYEVITVIYPYNKYYGSYKDKKYFFGNDILKILPSITGETAFLGAKTITETNKILHDFHEKDKYLDIFREYNTPIFITWLDKGWSSYSINNPNKKDHEIKVNICLKDFEFFKIKDAYTTFQEIQMFISGVLGNIEKDSTPLNDKEKIIAKGFDSRWSFRNPEPPKRKQKK